MKNNNEASKCATAIVSRHFATRWCASYEICGAIDRRANQKGRKVCEKSNIVYRLTNLLGSKEKVHAMRRCRNAC
eukprot:6185439-Pleurochrysis_carterae.AAC.3